MNAATPELEESIRQAFTRAEPNRIFQGCKVASEGGQHFVRVYSQRAGSPALPPPYQIFRYDPVHGTLTKPSQE